MQDVQNAQELEPVSVIFRRDPTGNKVAFIKDTLDLSVEGGNIAVWWEGRGRDVSLLPLSYYHSTQKLSDSDELDMANRFAEDYKPRYGVAIKKRLGKDLSHHPSLLQVDETAHKISKKEKQEFIEKIIAAFANAMREAL